MPQAGGDVLCTGNGGVPALNEDYQHRNWLLNCLSSVTQKPHISDINTIVSTEEAYSIPFRDNITAMLGMLCYVNPLTLLPTIVM